MDADASAKKPQVPFEEFSKLDLRVAKIVDAQPVAGADKLYRLTLRLGAEERVIVSGIADFYAPDELLGKKLVVVANLPPRKIRGEDSNGMLLAAVVENEEKKISSLSLVTVDNEDMEDGAVVC
jgi:methionyl-tRNA synthetase